MIHMRTFYLTKPNLQIHMTYNLIKLHLRNNNIQNVLITLFPRSINTRNNYCNHDLRFSLWKYLHQKFFKKYIILPWFYFIKSFFDAHMCIVHSGTINFIFHTFFFLPPKSSTELPWSLWYISFFCCSHTCFMTHLVNQDHLSGLECKSWGIYHGLCYITQWHLVELFNCQPPESLETWCDCL